MNRKFVAATGLVVALILSAGANAGYDSSPVVTISPGSSIDIAVGSLGAARRAADTVQYIGCSHSGSSAICMATNAAGVSVSCSTNAANHLTALQALSGDSHLTFAVDRSTGKCVSVSVRNYSYLTPK
jgi:hypothetical protein